MTVSDAHLQKDVVIASFFESICASFCKCASDPVRPVRSVISVQFEFSKNCTVEIMENLESVKSIAKSIFRMCLIENIQGFMIRRFCGSLQLISKLKNQRRSTDFPDFLDFP